MKCKVSHRRRVQALERPSATKQARSNLEMSDVHDLQNLPSGKILDATWTQGVALTCALGEKEKNTNTLAARLNEIQSFMIMFFVWSSCCGTGGQLLQTLQNRSRP